MSSIVGVVEGLSLLDVESNVGLFDGRGVFLSKRKDGDDNNKEHDF